MGGGGSGIAWLLAGKCKPKGIWRTTDEWSCPLCLVKGLLDAYCWIVYKPDTGEKILKKLWNEVVVYRNTLRCSNKHQISNFGTYLKPRTCRLIKQNICKYVSQPSNGDSLPQRQPGVNQLVGSTNWTRNTPLCLLLISTSGHAHKNAVCSLQHWMSWLRVWPGRKNIRTATGLYDTNVFAATYCTTGDHFNKITLKLNPRLSKIRWSVHHQ